MRAITSVVDGERHTKFDDWPPYTRLGVNALNLEAEALRALKEYDYEITEWRFDVFDDTAIASFAIK